MTFCMCMSLYDGNIVRVNVALAVASQLSKVWRNDRGSTGKLKTFKRGSGVFLYTPKMRLTQF